MAGWQDVEGWFTEEDAVGLSRLMRSIPPGGSTAHVGILAGRHLAAMAEVIKHGGLSVLAVDPWGEGESGEIYVKDESGQTVKAVRSWALAAISFGRTVEQFHLACEIMACSSLSAAGECRKARRSFDLVFIDADHQKEFVLADVMAWTPLLKSGGVLCGHDYGEPSHTGVKDVVDCLDGPWFPGGSIWAWRKP